MALPERRVFLTQLEEFHVEFHFVSVSRRLPLEIPGLFYEVLQKGTIRLAIIPLYEVHEFYFIDYLLLEKSLFAFASSLIKTFRELQFILA